MVLVDGRRDDARQELGIALDLRENVPVHRPLVVGRENQVVRRVVVRPQPFALRIVDQDGHIRVEAAQFVM